MDSFRVGLVPGVTPDRWVRTWSRRQPGRSLVLEQVAPADQLAAVREAAVHMCFVRDLERPEDLHVIPLYEEVPVVVVGRDHPVAAYDEIPVADLVHEHLLRDPDDVREALATVAAGTGIVVMPMSVARMHQRKDVVAVPVTGVAGSWIGLAWRRDAEDDAIETFIGIVRGRTEHSSRGSVPERTAAPGRAPEKPQPEKRQRRDRRGRR